MNFSVKEWFAALSQREKILIGILAVLLALTIGIYGMVRPFIGSLNAAEERYAQAVQRQAAIERKISWLKEGAERKNTSASGPIDVIISQTAGEKGFAVGSLNPQDNGRVNMVISSAKSTALFAWLAELEAQGIIAEQANIEPGPSQTLKATLSLKSSR